MTSDSSSDNKLVVRVEDGDELCAKLLALGNRLKPVDDENFFFFEIVRELVDAVLTNYRQLRQSYVDRDYPRLASGRMTCAAPAQMYGPPLCRKRKVI
jgi:hypothetical protein